MNHSFRWVALIAFVLSGCAALEREQEDYVEFDKPSPVARSEAECAARGGKWGPAGLLVDPICDIRPSDAGKACTDSQQCESKCVTVARVRYGASAPGVCHDSFLPFGCLQRIRAGRAGQALCID